MTKHSPRKIFAFASLALATAFISPREATAAKLDLMLDTEIKAASYGNVNFADPTPYNAGFFTQNAGAGFTIKNIKPSLAHDTSIDISIKLRAVGVSGSTAPYRPPFDQAADRYPSTSFVPYMENAYVRVNNIFNSRMAFTAGRQPFKLATGMTLSDDGLGFGGFSLKQDKALWDIGWQAFAFVPYTAQQGASEVYITGASLSLPAEGLWQLYSFWELDNRTQTVLAQQMNKATRMFSGISYSMRIGNMAFEGEGAIQRGTAKSGGGGNSISYKGYAFIASGRWTQSLMKLGTGAARLSIGRASGDRTDTASTDEAFFPSFGHRYNGLERSGFGEVFASSLYDAMGGTATTANGLPAGVSGIQMINFGLTLPPVKGIITELDYYAFEAATSATGGQRLGSEFDVRLVYLLGDPLKITFAAGTFKPGSAYADGVKSPSKVSLEVSSRF